MRAAFLLLLATACSGSSSSGPADAAPPGPCEAGRPGVRAHLTFDVQLNSPSAYWSDMAPLGVITTGGAFEGNCPIATSDVGPDWTATILCAYPPGTAVGPASLHFYSIAGGPSQWEGQPNTFTADPAACVDAEMHVRYRDISIDAGGADGAP
jgi:hypothetical protein